LIGIIMSAVSTDLSATDILVRSQSNLLVKG
jgi:hypothetical protein